MQVVVVVVSCVVVVVSRSAVSDSLQPQWATVRQVPLSMGFPRQEYWSRLPSPLPRDLPNTRIESTSPASVGRFFTTELPGKP